jgi:hypothetical protein
MSRFKELVKSPHIHISLATGLSIIVLAYFSKRILPEPIGYLPLAMPPFIATIYESVLAKYKDSKICTTWYWVVAIVVATALVIILSWKGII